jgi:hypothetical protein
MTEEALLILLSEERDYQTYLYWEITYRMTRHYASSNVSSLRVRLACTLSLAR